MKLAERSEDALATAVAALAENGERLLEVCVRLLQPAVCFERVPEGLDRLGGHVNVLRGRDPQLWRTRITSYARVRYEEVYPGVGLVFHGSDRQLEFDFELEPGVDPRVIRLVYEGARKLRLAADGDLVVETEAGELIQRAPVAFQVIEGRRLAVAAEHVLDGTGAVVFAVGPHDIRHPLVIDPVLVYSTYVGGSGIDEAYGIAVDGSGSAYVTGYTFSADFPTTVGTFQLASAGSYDSFVTKLEVDGTGFIYSTLFGRNGYDKWPSSRSLLN